MIEKQAGSKNFGLRPGQFSRVRRFKPAEYGIMKWWLMSLGDKSVPPARGTEFIEIEEIVPTSIMGNLVIFRQWIVDPDGREIASKFTPNASRKTRKFRAERQLQQNLISMGFNPVRPAMRDFATNLAHGLLN